MYTLKDISTARLINVYGRAHDFNLVDAVLKIKKYGIKNYEDLKVFVEGGHLDFQNPYFRDWLFEAKNALFKINSKQLEIPRFFFKIYETSGLDVKALNRVDASVWANILLVSSPLNSQYTTCDRLEDFTIAELKNLLGLITLEGKNALMSMLSSFGRSKLEKVNGAIRFYDDQVLRLARSTPDYMSTDNLFFKDIDLKREMIVADIEQICFELLSGGNDYIFGFLSDNSKESLRRIMIMPRDSKDKAARRRIIDMIANYVLREELDRGETRVRALERFHK